MDWPRGRQGPRDALAPDLHICELALAANGAQPLHGVYGAADIACDHLAVAVRASDAAIATG